MDTETGMDRQMDHHPDARVATKDRGGQFPDFRKSLMSAASFISSRIFDFTDSGAVRVPSATRSASRTACARKLCSREFGTEAGRTTETPFREWICPDQPTTPRERQSCAA